MSSLSTLPKGDSAWLLRKSIQRIMQQVSVLETNIGSSTTGNSADTQVIFNDAGTLRGDTGLTYDKSADRLSFGAGICYGLLTSASATITGDLTVDTSTLKVDSANDRVGIGITAPGYNLHVGSAAYASVGTSIDSITQTSHIFKGTPDAVGYEYAKILSGRESSPFTYGSFLAFYTEGKNSGTTDTSTERYKIDSTGVATWSNVGGVAGTAMTLNSTGLGVGGSPTRKLSIVGSGNTYANINSGDNTSLVGVLFGGTSAPSNGQIIYNNTDNSMGLHTAGAVKLTIDSSGNVGIGVTPSAWGSTYRALQIGIGTSLTGITNDVDINLVNNARFDGTNWKYTNSSPSERYRTASGTHYWYNAASGTAGNNITWTQAMTLDASGNLLVGTPSQNGSWNTKLTLSNDSGTTKWAVGPYLGGVTNFLISAGAAAGVYLNGTAATSWTSASDERLKDIIEPISNAIAKVGSLRAVIGKFKFDENNTRKPFLIAQDIQAVLPEAVDASNPEKLGVAYTDVIPLLVAAIKELTARVQTLETR